MNPDYEFHYNAIKSLANLCFDLGQPYLYAELNRSANTYAIALWCTHLITTEERDKLLGNPSKADVKRQLNSVYGKLTPNSDLDLTKIHTDTALLKEE